jgi:molecular chaperone DnaK (HSP70)
VDDGTIMLILEPEAAWCHCVRENCTAEFLKPGKTGLIVDGGGGTFDLTMHSILHVEPGGVVVDRGVRNVSPEEDEDLHPSELSGLSFAETAKGGGNMFGGASINKKISDAIYNHIRHPDIEGIDKITAKDRHDLEKAIEETKISLTSYSELVVPLPNRIAYCVEKANELRPDSQLLLTDDIYAVFSPELCRAFFKESMDHLQSEVVRMVKEARDKNGILFHLLSFFLSLVSFRFV